MTRGGPPMRHAGRWKIVAFLLAILVVGLVAGAKAFLSSRRAAEEVAARLRTLLNVPVEVGKAHIGIAGESSLGEVQVYEAGEPGPSAKPWMEVREVQANVGAVGLLGREASPSLVTLRGLSAELHFDQ